MVPTDISTPTSCLTLTHTIGGLSCTVWPHYTTRQTERLSLEPRGYVDISYAGRHLWKFEKMVHNAASYCFGSNFSGVLPAPAIGGLLVCISDRLCALFCSI